MGFQIKTAAEQRDENMANTDIIATTDMYLNADQTKAVKEGDKAAFSLLVRKGRPVTREYEDLVTAKGSPKAKNKAAPKAANKGK